jgi:conjugal transfer pilus assembly protein TraW
VAFPKSIWAIALGAAVAAGAHAGQSIIGPTFPIAEPDTRAEIKAKAASVDWHAWAMRSPDKYAAFNAAKLPRAGKDGTYLFDPTYPLPQALLDRNGQVLYPAGYLINVYRTLKMPGRMIVIGPSDADYAWLMSVAKPTRVDKVLLANGNVFDERVKRHAPLFLLDQRFIERFGLRTVPSIVTQEGEKLRVTEYLVKEKG